MLINNENAAYVAEGDSITAFVTPQSYARLINTNASPPFGSFIDNAEGGDQLVHLVSRGAALDALLPIEPLNILSVLVGANDSLLSLGGGYSTPASYATALAVYLDARRAAGWRVILCTITTQSSNIKTVPFNFAVNTITRAWPIGIHFDALADFGANTIMGDVTSFTDYPTYWLDVTHPSALGQQLLESIIQPIIENMGPNPSIPSTPSTHGVRRPRAVNRRFRSVVQQRSVRGYF